MPVFGYHTGIFGAYDILGPKLGAGDTLEAKQMWSHPALFSCQPMGDTHLSNDHRLI